MSEWFDSTGGQDSFREYCRNEIDDDHESADLARDALNLLGAYIKVKSALEQQQAEIERLKTQMDAEDRDAAAENRRLAVEIERLRDLHYKRTNDSEHLINRAKAAEAELEAARRVCEAAAADLKFARDCDRALFDTTDAEWLSGAADTEKALIAALAEWRKLTEARVLGQKE